MRLHMIFALSISAALSCSCGARSEPNYSNVINRGSAESAKYDLESKEIASTLSKYKLGSSSERGEELGVVLGDQFTKWPKQFIEQAIFAGYSNRQIARFIVMLPVSFVDEPCRSSKELLRRQQLLASLKEHREQIREIDAFVNKSIERDLKNCKPKI